MKNPGDRLPIDDIPSSTSSSFAKDRETEGRKTRIRKRERGGYKGRRRASGTRDKEDDDAGVSRGERER